MNDRSDALSSDPVDAGTADPVIRDADVARRRLGVGSGAATSGNATMARLRRPPKPRHLARRRRVLTYSKFGLPALALLLLGAIAAWPEISRQLMLASDVARQLAAIRRDSGRMISPHYSGIDSHDRPYTLTAVSGRQLGQNRIDLDAPIMDMTTATGWIELSADHGTYMQDSDMLDLSGHVMLYRDDGILAFSPVADIDVKAGVIASVDWIHADGPFGILDAQGYTLAQNSGIAQFTGPARLVLNDDHVARESPDPAAGSKVAAEAVATAPAPRPAQTPSRARVSHARTRHHTHSGSPSR